MKTTPGLLIILDGFGQGEDAPDNAISQAHTPNLDALLQQYPHTVINASETHVGLPTGQMGNSEVGHLNIGAGRVVVQEFDRINNAILSGEFYRNPVLLEGRATTQGVLALGQTLSIGLARLVLERRHRPAQLTPRSSPTVVIERQVIDPDQRPAGPHPVIGSDTTP
jgi:bisphosphoglycerate-independent phosphoglycerate mutase (AlkP superfamily)